MDRKAIKEEAKRRIEGIRFNLFLPLFVVTIISTIFTASIIGLLVSASFSYIGQMFALKFVRYNKRDFSSLTEEIGCVDNDVLLIKAGLRMFLYLLPCTAIGVVVSIVTPFTDSLILLIVMAILSIIASVVNIIIGVKYRLVGFIIKDADYNITSSEAFELCNQMTYGNKERIFIFEISFVFHYILAVLTLGIYFIALMPYVSISEAILYENIRDEFLTRNTGGLADKIRHYELDICDNTSTDEFDSVKREFDKENIDPFDGRDNEQVGNDNASDPFDDKSIDTPIDPFDGNSDGNATENREDIDPFS